MSLLAGYRVKILLLFFILMICSISASALAGDKAAGKEKSMLCMGCHGAEGISVSPEIPNLAGQKPVYLVNTIKDFRAEVRKNPIMNSMVKGLSDADIDNLAAYYSSLK